MRFMAIDIETTGLDPEQDQVLEFAAVYSNGDAFDSLQRFRAVFLHERISGHPVALSMNAELISEIKNYLTEPSSKNGIVFPEVAPLPYTVVCRPEEFAKYYVGWLEDRCGIFPKDRLSRQRILYGGKNVAGFDLLFLDKLHGFKEIKRYHRVLDPAIYFIDPRIDSVPPDLAECQKRGFLPEVQGHRAMNDAESIVELMNVIFTDQLARSARNLVPGV